MFNSSLKDNIAYGTKSATLKEIKQAAKAANIDFISKLDNGLDTLVGERGIKLSGGQRQRVGIARAILARPSILIFDEATSNLDTHSERLVQEAITKISATQTMITIAHRLSTIRRVDRILVIEGGRIVEQGSHDRLMKRKGRYHSLYKQQFRQTKAALA